MPTRTGTLTRILPAAFQMVWTGLLNTDDGSAWDYVEGAADDFVSVTGTFGVGGTLVIQGSADGVTWSTLTQAGGSTTATDANAASVNADITAYAALNGSASSGANSTAASGGYGFSAANGFPVVNHARE